MNTFLCYYNSNYKQKLQDIDLFLKTTTSIEDQKSNVATLLDIDLQEVYTLISDFGITNLDEMSFFKLMRHGSSDICKLLNRQLHIGIKTHYTAFEISYIYQIPHDIILYAMDQAGIDLINDLNLHSLFSHIQMV